MKIRRDTFDLEKTINAVLYIVNKLHRRDFHKIFKILYFSDRDHLSRFGRPITGDTYIAMQDGPVPSCLYDIFKALRGNGYFAYNTSDFQDFFRVVNWNYIDPLREADTESLSQSDMNVLDENISKYGEMSWEDVRAESHGYAWNNTARDHEISVTDILYEAGDSPEYIAYVNESLRLKSALV